MAPLPGATTDGHPKWWLVWGWCRAPEPQGSPTCSQSPWGHVRDPRTQGAAPEGPFPSGPFRRCKGHISPPHVGFGVGLDPKRSNPTTWDPTHSLGEGLHRGTQPLHALPALFSPGFWSKPQPAIFVVAPVPRQVPPQGAVPMGYCRKLPDGHRSPPGGSRVSAARSH